MKRSLIAFGLGIAIFGGVFAIGLTPTPSGGTSFGTSSSCIPSGGGTAYFCNIDVEGTGTIATPVLGGTSITVADTVNEVVLTLNQDDVTNNPSTLVIVNAGTGDSLVIDTSEFVIDDVGNVGIGIAIPTAELHVEGGQILVTSDANDDWTFKIDAGKDATVELDRGSVGRRGFVEFSTADASDWFLGIPDNNGLGDASEFYIGTTDSGAAPAIWIETSGNVGIGVSDPVSNLELGDAAGVKQYMRRIDSSTEVNNLIGESVFTATDSTESLLNSIGAKISVFADGGWGTTANDHPSRIQFFTESDGSVTSLANPRMTIDSTGFVGIGDVAPASPLHVAHATEDFMLRVKSGDDRSAIILEDNDSTAYVLAQNQTMSLGREATVHATNINILATGEVGLGTTTPNTRLDVQGGLTLNMTTVAAGTYDLLITDYILNVTYTGTAAVTSLTLPTAQAVEGRTIVVKDAGGASGVNNITIDTEGGGTIDGAATAVIAGNYDSLTLYSDGTNWFIY